MSFESAPFLDLFDRLREHDMALTYPQYEKFLQALLLPGLLTCEDPWQRVKEYGRLIWVKPSSRFAQVTYDRIFEQYRQSYEGQIFHHLQENLVESEPEPESKPIFQAGLMPILPPRQEEAEAALPETQSDPQGDVVTAMSLPDVFLETSQPHAFILESQDLPITGKRLVECWQWGQRVDQSSPGRRIDLKKFRRQLIRSYPEYQMVYQSQRQPVANLVLLVDTALSMRPFLPWVESLIQALDRDLAGHSAIFYFLHFPQGVLYPRLNPTLGLGLDTDQLSALFQARTTVLMVSEAGSVKGEAFPERIAGMKAFLSKMAPRVAQIVTVNPMPLKTWEQSCAAALKDCPEHQMLSLDGLSSERLLELFGQQALLEVGV